MLWCIGAECMSSDVPPNVLVSVHGQEPHSMCASRCAATANIDSNAASVGAPAFLPTTASNHQFYFVTMVLDHSSRNSAQSILSALTGMLLRPPDHDCLHNALATTILLASNRWTASCSCVHSCCPVSIDLPG